MFYWWKVNRRDDLHSHAVLAPEASLQSWECVELELDEKLKLLDLTQELETQTGFSLWFHVSGFHWVPIFEPKPYEVAKRDPILECTTHLILVGIGMFTGGTGF